MPCFAVAPLRGERNGNSIVIDVPEKRYVLIQDKLAHQEIPMRIAPGFLLSEQAEIGKPLDDGVEALD